MPKKKKDAALPRPVSRSEPEESDEEEEEDDFSDEVAVQVRPGLLPAPLRDDPPGPSDPVIPPYADFLQFSQVPEVPRRLAGVKEIRGAAWPLAAPEEICSGTTHIAISTGKDVSLPGALFGKHHKFTVFTFSELDLQSDKPCASIAVEKDDEEEEEESTMRFGDLSNKVDFCMSVKNVYKFDPKIVKDAAGVFKTVKPRICGACSLKAKAFLLPDLRHKYMFTFHHTIHIHGPSGVDFDGVVRLLEKSRIDALGVKICPLGPKNKPEITRLLQATHFIRVSITVTPRTSAVMPRPLPPELREPQQLVFDEDFLDKSEIQYEDKEIEEAASRPDPASSNTAIKKPNRSEPD